MHRNHLPLLAVTVALAASPVFAQTPAPPPDAPVEAVPDDIKAAVAAKKEGERKEGFDATARVGASGLLLHNHQVVGQLDGFTLNVGLVLGGALNYVRGNHEWQNTASYDLSFSKTPAIETLLKSADNLEARSLYLYRIPGLEWLGPFVRVRGYTQVFPGYAVPADDVTVRRIQRDGNENVFRAPAQLPIDLTTWFEPIVLAESAGMFLRPLDETWLSLDAKAGLGAQHVFAFGDGYVVADDAATPELEIKQLENVQSAGVELEVEAKGSLFLEGLSYGLTTTLYYPLIVSVDTDIGPLEIVHLDVAGNLSYKLTDWLSADYVLRVRRAPFVLNDFQVQNSVLLTLGFNVL